MQINIDEYDMEYYCWQCNRKAIQPRVQISVSLESRGEIHGEAHLHKIMNLSCHNGPMISDRKANLMTRSFSINDETEHYQTCARIVMEYIARGFEMTYLKLI